MADRLVADVARKLDALRPWTVIHLFIDSLIEESLANVSGGVFRATWKWMG
jgi:hypothetical protein